MKILMIGVTGEFAGLVVPELKRRGAIVRALIHNPKSEKPARDRGADEIAMGDLADTRSLIAAAQGVDSVFHINPAFVPDEARFGINMVDAAVAAGAKKIVFPGVLHPSYLELSNHAAKLPVEQAIYTSGLAYTVLQPTIFMQGTVPPAAWPQIVQHRQFAMPYSKEKKAAYVDYRDVAEAAALALTSDRLDYGTFELCAPGMLTRTEIAVLMTEAAGVQFRQSMCRSTTGCSSRRFPKVRSAIYSAPCSPDSTRTGSPAAMASCSGLSSAANRARSGNFSVTWPRKNKPSQLRCPW